MVVGVNGESVEVILYCSGLEGEVGISVGEMGKGEEGVVFGY